jgi:chemotaxis receptor (MCP) glutamine deamidase CheD
MSTASQDGDRKPRDAGRVAGLDCPDGWQNVIGLAEPNPDCVQHRLGNMGFNSVAKELGTAKELAEVLVAPDTYHVSPEPMLLIADLHGALALCLHDEARGVGGLLHLKFIGGTGRPSDVTDNTLSSVLTVLDRFKRGVLGNTAKRDEIQARILAHGLPPTDIGEPSASLVDLIQADLADGKINCGTQTVRRTESLRVCFQPFEGRVWIAGPNNQRDRRARRLG